MIPNITVMASYKNYKEIPVNSIKFDDDVIAWAGHENTKKRFKSTQCLWTIQCTEHFSKKIINIFKKDKKKYQKIIIKKFEKLTGYQSKNIIHLGIHGWKYAYSKRDTKLNFTWSNKNQLGVCGDWFSGSKLENAWQSSNLLYTEIKKNPLKSIKRV